MDSSSVNMDQDLLYYVSRLTVVILTKYSIALANSRKYDVCLTRTLRLLCRLMLEFGGSPDVAKYCIPFRTDGDKEN